MLCNKLLFIVICMWTCMAHAQRGIPIPIPPVHPAPQFLIDPATGNVSLDFNDNFISAIIIESKLGIFNGNEPEWNIFSPFHIETPFEISNAFFTQLPGGIGAPNDDLGQLISEDFIGRSMLFYQNDITEFYLISAVPEPSSIALFAIGCITLVCFTLLSLRWV